MPPTLINNNFTLHPACGGWGDYRLKIEKLQRGDEIAVAESLCNIQVSTAQ
jgi:hypothetical protein